MPANAGMQSDPIVDTPWQFRMLGETHCANVPDAIGDYAPESNSERPRAMHAPGTCWGFGRVLAMGWLRGKRVYKKDRQELDVIPILNQHFSYKSTTQHNPTPPPPPPPPKKMPNLLVIFGITGHQGTSLATKIHTHPTLSKQYTLRGLTRDPTQPRAAALSALGIPLFTTDPTSPSSLAAALEGAHTVFIMTSTSYAPGGHAAERTLALRIVDACVAAGARFLVWSGVPSPAEVSGGAVSVEAWEVKADVGRYIRGLEKEGKGVRSGVYAPGYYMQNMGGYEAVREREGDGVLVVRGYICAETRVPMVDVAGDTGEFVGAMLEVWAAGGWWSVAERVEVMGRVLGREVVYERVGREEWLAGVPGEVAREGMGNMYDYIERYGYFGPDGEELVRESAKLVKGKLTSLEEYLVREPLKV
ncbi:NAD(P)-binding protein [Pseudovirgaria hyperparasitica]|uniref:NAD(P)-binding protein n=1 Tax=Pseudovirgaria hyperparasitica TaxID=470096 RepID=A0A6A6WBE2_9PEZI|nr:NAD(P)-binding protein [Pseudovirgaria hyperparasitica]KAF2759280.1 NAD(P)-binding protein [Pseudovirgaria hyperparasitica]